MNFEIAVELI